MQYQACQVSEFLLRFMVLTWISQSHGMTRNPQGKLISEFELPSIRLSFSEQNDSVHKDWSSFVYTRKRNYLLKSSSLRLWKVGRSAPKNIWNPDSVYSNLMKEIDVLCFKKFSKIFLFSKFFILLLRKLGYFIIIKLCFPSRKWSFHFIFTEIYFYLPKIPKTC